MSEQRPVTHLGFYRLLKGLNPWHRRRAQKLAEDIAATRSLTIEEAQERLRGPEKRG